MTTRRCRVWFFNGLGQGLRSLAAGLFGLGVLGFDVAVLATFGLPPGAVPAVQLVLAIRMLTVALVITMRPVFACAPVRRQSAGAGGRRGLDRRRRVPVLWQAHGRFGLQGKARGECATIRPEPIKTRIKTTLAVHHRRALNQTENETTLEKRHRTRRPDQ